jgi:hypothetical protein
MRGRSLRWHRPRTLGATGTVDSGSLKGPLQDSRRGDRVRRERFEEFDANAAGPPAGVFSLDPAGVAEDGLGVGGGGTAAGVVANDQAIGPSVAEGPPEVTDGNVGNPEFDGDEGQRLTSDVSFDDVLSCGGREGTGHEKSPQGPMEQPDKEIITCPDLWVKLRDASGGRT